MRTKALLAAAILAAGLASSMAQTNVYSLNVVGYYNVTVPAGKFALVANQLTNANSKLTALIPNPPANSQVMFFHPGSGWSEIYNFDEFDSVWTGTPSYPVENRDLTPGVGFMFKNGDSVADYTLTFVGEVMQGSQSVNIGAGQNMISSKVPQAGDLVSMGLVATANDQMQRFDKATQKFENTIYNFDEFDEVWTPSNPPVTVGEGFYYNANTAKTWTRNFTVPQN